MKRTLRLAWRVLRGFGEYLGEGYDAFKETTPYASRGFPRRRRRRR